MVSMPLGKHDVLVFAIILPMKKLTKKWYFRNFYFDIDLSLSIIVSVRTIYQ